MSRADLVQAVDAARARVKRARDSYYASGKTFDSLASLTIAECEFRAISKELAVFDRDRNVQAVYGMDVRGPRGWVRERSTR